MKEIKLYGGKVAIVDDDDYERLKNFKYSFGSGYPMRWEFALCKLHDDVLGPTAAHLETHHINGNTLDNRKCNLVSVTRAQHNQLRSTNKTGFLGVFELPNKRKPYVGRVKKDLKVYSTRTFVTKEEAARARDELAFTLYGFDCVFNFPRFEVNPQAAPAVPAN